MDAESEEMLVLVVSCITKIDAHYA